MPLKSKGPGKGTIFKMKMLLQQLLDLGDQIRQDIHLRFKYDPRMVTIRRDFTGPNSILRKLARDAVQNLQSDNTTKQIKGVLRLLAIFEIWSDCIAIIGIPIWLMWNPCILAFGISERVMLIPVRLYWIMKKRKSEGSW